MKEVLLALVYLFVMGRTQAQVTVRQIYYDMPPGLAKDTLLVPAYDVFDEGKLYGQALKKLRRFNRSAEEGNETLTKLLLKHYGMPFRLVPLSEVATYQQAGYTYFLDVVAMPRQWPKGEAGAMYASFRRYKTANNMYRINNFQFHYYFYIRELQTEDAFFATKPRGHRDVYTAMTLLFKHASKGVQID